ncbi:MAG: LysE family transporter [Bacteroidota bacterium]
MILVYTFLLSFVVSLVGSIQPGPVNLAIFAACLQKQYKNAVYTAIGGSTPEFVFCLIALKAANYIAGWKNLFTIFQITLAVLLLVAAAFLWFNKTHTTAKVTKQHGFMLGATLAVLNPQLIIFWTSVITYIQVNNILQTNLFENPMHLLLFSLGAVFGAFTLHLILIVISKLYIKIPVQSFFKYADKTIAVIFIILATFQTIKLFI